MKKIYAIVFLLSVFVISESFATNLPEFFGNYIKLQDETFLELNKNNNLGSTGWYVKPQKTKSNNLNSLDELFGKALKANSSTKIFLSRLSNIQITSNDLKGFIVYGEHDVNDIKIVKLSNRVIPTNAVLASYEGPKPIDKKNMWLINRFYDFQIKPLADKMYYLKTREPLIGGHYAVKIGANITDFKVLNVLSKSDLTKYSKVFPGAWEGNYICGQKVTGLTLNILTVSSDISAIYNFYPLQQNSKAKSGSYFLTGQFSKDGFFDLQPKVWINHPKGYEMVGLSGKINDNLTELEGSIDSSGCSIFQLHKSESQQTLPYSERLAAILYIVNFINDDSVKAEALGMIASELLKGGEIEKGEKILSNALTIAKSVPNNSYVFYSIAENLARAGEIEKALKLANSIKHVNTKYRARASVIIALVKADQIEKALEIVNSLEIRSNWKSYVLANIAEALAKDNKIEKALKIANFIDPKSNWDSYLYRIIVVELLKGGEIEKAMEIANSIEDGRYKSYALGTIAIELAKAGEIEKGEKILSNALKIAYSIEDRERQAITLGSIAVDLLKGGKKERIEKGEKILSSSFKIANSATKKTQYFYPQIISTLIKAGEIEKLMKIANSTEITNWYFSVPSLIAVELAKAGEIEKAMEIANSIEDGENDVHMYGTIAVGLLKGNEIEKGEKILSNVFKIANSNEDDRRKSNALYGITAQLAKIDNKSKDEDAKIAKLILTTFIHSL